MTADELIRMLRLQPHPREDGFFRETYRSKEGFPGREQERCASTAIYFLLRSHGFSEMHRLPFDEIYHYYLGAALEMLILHPGGSGRVVRLGCGVEHGEEPQIIVPGGCWQGSRTTGDFTLFGCTVAPGFEYADYESGSRQALLQQYPEFDRWIRDRTPGE
jgi:predicted cupin superfamily sugar epimerase